MYQNPDIESSYRENNLGQTIYDFIVKEKPKKVIEFGCLYGYSTVAIAMALKHNGFGKLYSHDLFEDYQFKHSTLEKTKQNIAKYNVTEYVEFIKMDFNKWLKNPTDFDVLHLDISNTGDTLLKAEYFLRDQINNGSKIIFEGGSVERDNIEWMKKYDMIPMNNIKPLVEYKIINEAFPSLSVIGE